MGALIGGTLADRWMRRTQRGRIFVSAIGMMMFLPTQFSVSNAGTIGAAIIGLLVFGFGERGFGFLRDSHEPLNLIFGVFGGVALLSVVISR